MDLNTNSSNNTVYADDQGNIAYWHGNFIPKRNTQFNWNAPLDGSNPATKWKGLHSVNEMIHVYNPATGWIQNCNSTPFTVAGISSPDKSKYPNYMAPDEENARGIHAIKVLEKENGFTLDKLIAAAYDSYLPGFEKLVPSFIKAYDELAPGNDTLRSKYEEPIQLVRNWDLRYSVSSVPTTLSIYWAFQLRQNTLSKIPAGLDQMRIIGWLQTETSSNEKVKALAEAVAELQRDFGNWKQPWGKVNRFQRLRGEINAGFDDEHPSLAVPFTSSFWGSLAAYGSRRYPNTKKMYGSVGNSFVAVVEFGKKLSAKAIMSGGQNSDPNSPHFKDQATLYSQGQFRDVLFYKEDIMSHLERTYTPGKR